MPTLRPLTLLLLCAAIAGDARAEAPSTTQLKQRFVPPAGAIVAKRVAVDGAMMGIRCERVTFPSPVKTPEPVNNTVHGLLYTPARPTDRAIIFLPWFKDGNTSKIELIGQTLAAGGFKVLCLSMGYQFQRAPKGYGSGSFIIKGEGVRRDGIKHIQRWMTQAVQDARCARRWLISDCGVHADKVGLMGISLGGFVTGLSYGVSKPGEFHSAAVLLAGGGFHKFLSIGLEAGVGPVHEALTAMKLKPDQLEAAVRPYDPATYGDPARKAGLLLVGGMTDPVVPFPLVTTLWKAYGKGPFMRLPTGHVTSVPLSPLVLARVLRHFNARMPKAPN